MAGAILFFDPDTSKIFPLVKKYSSSGCIFFGALSCLVWLKNSHTYADTSAVFVGTPTPIIIPWHC
jgi:hypothetical protein